MEDVENVKHLANQHVRHRVQWAIKSAKMMRENK